MESPSLYFVIRPKKVRRKSAQPSQRLLEPVNRDHYTSVLKQIRPALSLLPVSHCLGVFFTVLLPNEDAERPRAQTESTTELHYSSVIDEFCRVAKNVMSVSVSQRCAASDDVPQSQLVEFVVDSVRTVADNKDRFSLQLRCNRPRVGDGSTQQLHNCLVDAFTRQLRLKYEKKDPSEEQEGLLRILIDVDEASLFVGTGRSVSKGVPNSVERASAVELKERSLCLLCKFGEVFLKGKNRTQIVQDLRDAVAVKFGRLAKSVFVDFAQHIVVVLSNDCVHEKALELGSQIPGLAKVVLCRPSLVNVDAAAELVADRIIRHLSQNDANGEVQVFFRLSIRKGCTLSEEDVWSRAVGLVEKTCFGRNIKLIRCKQKIEGVLQCCLVTSAKSVYLKEIEKPGLGGLPFNAHQSVVALLSGGIDSPVASFLMMKRGAKVHLAHFQNASSFDENAVIDKVSRLGKVLAKFQPQLLLWIVPFGALQDAIIADIVPEHRMLVYRFFMTKIASDIARSRGSSFLVTGDSYGQVASQTIRNLEAVYSLSPRPILCPLIGLDKTEIKGVATKIGTLQLSELPYGDCCSFFVADHPSLNLRIKGNAVVQELQKLVASVKNGEVLARRALKGAKLICFQQRDGEVIEKVVRDFSKEFENRAGSNSVGGGECWIEPRSSGKVAEDRPPTMVESEMHSNLENDLKEVEEESLPVSVPSSLPSPSFSSLIHLDNAASTVCCDESVRTMVSLMSSGANAFSSHALGQSASRTLEQARLDLANVIGCKPQEIVFTSGGTEANNLAIIGRAFSDQCPSNAHFICLQTDHASVLEPMRFLERRGFRISFCRVERDGLIDMSHLEELLSVSDTALMSFCHVNSEIGVVQDVDRIRALRDKIAPKCALFADCCQSFTKVDFKVDKVDMMSINSHKIHGPTGAGALVVCESLLRHHSNILFGGGPGLRPGTPAVPLIAAFVVAAKQNAQREHLESLRDGLWQRLCGIGVNIQLNGSNTHRAPHILNVTFPGIDASRLLKTLSMNGVLASGGSACSSAGGKETLSHVLLSLAMSEDNVRSSVRFSVSRLLSAEDLDVAAKRIHDAVKSATKN